MLVVGLLVCLHEIQIYKHYSNYIDGRNDTNENETIQN